MSTEGKPRLELRPAPWIAAAYVAAPVVAATLLWLVLVVPPLMRGGMVAGLTPASLFHLWLIMLFWGGGVTLLVELAVATPLLVRFSQGGWTGLNGKIAAAIGFAVGFVPAFVTEALPPKPHTSVLIGGQWIVQNGHRTWEGWKHVVWDALTMGLIGLAAALVFWLLAMRTVKE